ncbi:hypothetical protein AVEN_265684-1 [Araneus ventricosus]|uniref:Peptidase A2 domain-containing protein n=1 Tax=Araneus ventricosus TaxID=182803 RepID=A0A4Y2KAL4_ARAVE|nr:hypothetical protein AVEN_265684-1 [Araneus ventricosus]
MLFGCSGKLSNRIFRRHSQRRRYATFNEIDGRKDLKSALAYTSMNLAAEQNARRRNPNVTCWNSNKRGHRQRECQANYVHPGKLIFGRLAERGIPFLNRAPEEGLKASTLSGEGNGLYLKRSICDIPRLMLVDTGTNVTLLREDLARKLKKRLIYTAPNISFKTATGEKAEIHGKLDATIECESRKSQCRV